MSRRKRGEVNRRRTNNTVHLLFIGGRTRRSGLLVAGESCESMLFYVLLQVILYVVRTMMESETGSRRRLQISTSMAFLLSIWCTTPPWYNDER